MSSIAVPLVARLPRAADALLAAILSLLTAAAKHKSLPPLLRRERDRMAKRHAELQAAADAAGAPRTAATSSQAADYSEDRAFIALYHFLIGWSLSLGDEADTASAAIDALYPTRLLFTKLPYHQEWAHADRLLRLLDEPRDGGSLAEQIAALGGVALLEQLHGVHHDYGAALGITESAPQPPAPTPLPEPTAALFTAAQKYLGAVVAWTDEEDPESVALCTSLLAPLDEIPVPTRTRKHHPHPHPKTAAPATDAQTPPVPTPPLHLVADATGPAAQGARADARS